MILLLPIFTYFCFYCGVSRRVCRCGYCWSLVSTSRRVCASGVGSSGCLGGLLARRPLCHFTARHFRALAFRDSVPSIVQEPGVIYLMEMTRCLVSISGGVIP